MIIFKNVFSCALTMRAFDWLVDTQTKATPIFNAVASVQLVVCLLSIPMCKLTGRMLLLNDMLISACNRRLWKANSQLFSPP